MAANPSVSSTVAVRSALESSPKQHERPPKILARGPLWARLPPLRTMTTAVAASQSQPQGTPNSDHLGANVEDSGLSYRTPAPPPIVLPDRVATTRILLSDTQACVQKLSARMDAISERGEQALKEVQLAREALDVGGEKTVAELADVAYKCQATILKAYEMQSTIHRETKDQMAQLMTSNAAILKLYEAQSVSLTSLSQFIHDDATIRQNQWTQFLHTQTSTLQAIQTQQTQIISTLVPLEPLVRCIPLHVDSALSTHLSRVSDALVPAVEHAVERVLARLPMGEYMREANDQLQQPRRGQKRKQATEQGISPIDAERERPQVSDAQIILGQPSAPVHRVRLDSWTTARLRPRGSQSHLPVATEEVPSADVVVVLDQTPPRAPALQPSSSRKPTLPTTTETCTDSGRAYKRYRTRSRGPPASCIEEFGMMNTGNDGVTQPDVDVEVSDSGPSGVPNRSKKSTFSMELAALGLHTPARNPLQPRRTIQLSINNAPRGSDGNVVAGQAHSLSSGGAGSENVAPPVGSGIAGSGNVGPAPVSKAPTRSTTKSKTKSKRSKTKGGGTDKRKGKKVTASPPVDNMALQSDPAGSRVSKRLSLLPAPDLTCATAEAAPRQLTMGASAASPLRIPLAHRPSNVSFEKSLSTLTPTKRSGDTVTIDEDLEQAAVATTTKGSGSASNGRSLVDLMSSSPESSPSCQSTKRSGGASTSLSAALAHIARDVDFISGVTTDLSQQEISDVYAGAGTGPDSSTTNKSSIQPTEYLSTPGPGVVFNQPSGRAKRFIVVDNDSGAVDLLDGLFDEC